MKKGGKKNDSDKSKRRDVFGLVIPTELTQPKPTSNTDQGNNSSSSTPTSSTAPLTSTSSPARTPSISTSSTAHTPSTLSNIKVRIPTIRLPKSVANLPTLPTRTYEAPSDRPDEDETPPRKKVIFRVDSDSISSEDDDGAKKNETSARGEMKSILKTLPDTLNLDYKEIFMSPSNITKWLKSIHKSRRSRNSYKNKGRLDADDHRLHANGRMKDKKFCRIKGAKALYEKNDPKIAKYKRNELFDILQNSKVHSPERSETDEETDSSEK
ncbi:unnamed protein product [Rhizophagus irregularis]|nr:unnamed protein product [Rhizophagus irregularis]